MRSHWTPKWAIVVMTDLAVGLAVVWWIVRYAYAHDWLNVAIWCASGAGYYWFGPRYHMRWRREESG